MKVVLLSPAALILLWRRLERAYWGGVGARNVAAFYRPPGVP